MTRKTKSCATRLGIGLARPARPMLALLLAMALAALPTTMLPATQAFADLETATEAPGTEGAEADPALAAPDAGYKSSEGAALEQLAADGGTGGSGGADGSTAAGADGVAVDAGGAANSGTEQLHISLSEPKAEQHDYEVWYTTQLSVKGISSFYGYQIQVESAGGEGSIIIKSLAGGTATAPTYKDGSTHQAMILGSEGLSGDVTVCEITKKVPVDVARGSAADIGGTNAALSLVVLKVDAITNMGAGLMLSLGPDPAAATLVLPAVGGQSTGGIMPGTQVIIIYIILALALLGLVILAVYFVNRPRSRAAAVAASGTEGTEGLDGTTYALSSAASGHTDTNSSAEASGNAEAGCPGGNSGATV